MTKVEHHKVKEIKENSLFEKRMYNLFSASISDQVSLPDFRKLFSKYEKMDAYIMKKNGQDIGMSYFMLCKNPNRKKDIYVRLGLGIIEEERGRAHFPKKIILKTMLKTKFQNLFKDVFMVGITMNPIVYSATCKYWKYSYPSPVLEKSAPIKQAKNRILSRFHMNEVANDVIGVPFRITEVEKVKKQLSVVQSTNPYIKFFNSKIGSDECDKGLLSIVPIDTANLCIAAKRKTKADIKKFYDKVFEEKLKPMLKEYSAAG
ncbi:hypothetical protein D1816_03150 [Aquimarina sp. AD10]|uniref:Uncharacterized protein n=1 Tax=Aquimarina aggregata TaxID=1642818 RepID=A0A162DMF2_9FLAO|nr:MULTISPECIES: hypothetical protein [Aquimarina]AXT59387.1 hypothetical protein D1816_03150 [Aquimarina sp. AD10]KZS42618.1 hypothetical protein AWE51_04000 [Aquimarina aggregata]RKM94168.1 hypothetical protein D7033_18715 [Aquimarina sp. AD10]